MTRLHLLTTADSGIYADIDFMPPTTAAQQMTNMASISPRPYVKNLRGTQIIYQDSTLEYIMQLEELAINSNIMDLYYKLQHNFFAAESSLIEGTLVNFMTYTHIIPTHYVALSIKKSIIDASQIFAVDVNESI